MQDARRNVCLLTASCCGAVIDARWASELTRRYRSADVRLTIAHFAAGVIAELFRIVVSSLPQ